MKVTLIEIGGIAVSVPQEKLFDIVTLRTDLRPVIRALERIRDGKRHPGRPRKVEAELDKETKHE